MVTRNRKDDDWIFAWLAEPVDDWQLKTNESATATTEIDDTIEESTTLEFTPSSLVGNCETHGIIKLTPSGGFACKQCEEERGEG